jgi:hypothetical protein
MATLRWKKASAAPKVEGPIRCHRCRLMCRDAEHYLAHQCEPKVILTLVRPHAVTR